LALAFLLVVFLFVIVLIALFAFPPEALVRALQGQPKKKAQPKDPAKDGSA